MTPYPTDYSAEPSCATCTHWLGGLGEAPTAALCALKGRNTAPDSACIDWRLWVCKARAAEVA